MDSTVRTTATIFTLVGVLVTSACRAERGQPLAEEIFNQRILPIFRSTSPSSCVQCHLSSVDLKNYIKPTADATFASLRDQGLVDLNNPKASKILKLIEMGKRDEDEAARLIHQDKREAEYKAFATWIIASAMDPRMRKLPKLREAELARPAADEAVIRHARKSRLVDSFARNIWSQRMRCFPCHTPHEVDPQNPRHRAAIKKRREMREQYGEQIAELNLFRQTPEATLDFWIKSSQRRVANAGKDTPPPLIDLKAPTESLILLKPMAKLPPRRADGTFEAPSYTTPISHLGGLKLHRHDQSYKSIVAWIQDYSRILEGAYRSSDELPADNWRPTSRAIRVADLPEQWPVGTTIQLFVYVREGDQWRADPVAFTQSTITPRRMVFGSLFLLGGDASVDELLPQKATYRIELRVDRNNVLAKDPTRMLTKQAGFIEFKADGWEDGFRGAAKISAHELNTGEIAAQP